MSKTFDDCLFSARAGLARAKQLIQDEISSYPTPVSGCDAQFNYLLAERQKVVAAIRSLNESVFVPTPRTPTTQAELDNR